MNVTQHLPALLVLLPLLGAPLCALVPNARLAWFVATLVTGSALLVSAVIFHHVQSEGPWLYAMGDWDSPLGIIYKIDLFNSVIAILICLIATVIIPYASKSIMIEVQEEKQPFFYALFLTCVAGLLGITLTNDAFNIYVFLEISSITTYALIAMGKSRRSLMASFEYLILGTIGATFYLIGIGLLYAMTGTLNLDDLAIRIPLSADIRPIQGAFVFITLGLAMKIALFPLHQWLTNAYTYAPASISAFLASISTKVGIYVLIRIIFTLFGYDFSFNEIPLAHILFAFAVMAMLIGSMVSIFQTDLKRLLAFSSVAQIGYIILGLSFATETGMTAAITHVINDTFAKGCLFLIMGALVWQKSGATIHHLAGAAKQMPYVMPALIISTLSVIGVPLTGGFISKWYLVLAAIREDMWLAVFVILSSSIMAGIYCWRMVEAAYFREALHPLTHPRPLPLRMLLAIWILAAACLYLGVDTRMSAQLAEKIAVHFIQGTSW